MDEDYGVALTRRIACEHTGLPVIDYTSADLAGFRHVTVVVSNDHRFTIDVRTTATATPSSTSTATAAKGHQNRNEGG